jgi:hypothetical protein
MIGLIAGIAAGAGAIYLLNQGAGNSYYTAYWVPPLVAIVAYEVL